MEKHLVKMMAYLLKGRPTDYWTDCQMANPKERNLDCYWVKYSENRMANRTVNLTDLKMVFLRSALPMGSYLDCRLVNPMVINLEYLRLDSLKANQMVIHWDCRLG